MNRRKFLKNAALATGALSVNGFHLNAKPMAGLLEMVALSGGPDHVLVLINMLGGNDGLNTIIPAHPSQYNQYAGWRQNIAIPFNQLLVPQGLSNNTTIGFHPKMTGFYNLFEQENLAVIQNVSYPQINQSHFRSRDIWLSGSDSDEFWSSGWLGRYLSTVQWGSPDPIAIEVSAASTIALFDTDLQFNGFNVEDPEAFYNLVNGFPANNGSNLPNGYMADEILYILGVEQTTNAFANQLYLRYQAGGPPLVTYPGNYPGGNGFTPGGYYAQNALGKQLEIVAQLIRGGCETKVYICNINGFDTHVNQIHKMGLQAFPGEGYHAALLYYLSQSTEAFLSDLGGSSNKVLMATMSEFGRRVYSNSSIGTDHGDAAPMFVAGHCVKGGVYNTNPDLSSQAVNGNGGSVNRSSDFRSVFSTILIDWFGCSEDVVKDALTNGGIGWGDDLDNNGLADILENRPLLIEPGCIYVPPSLGITAQAGTEPVLFPNPAYDQAALKFITEIPADVTLTLYDMGGNYINHLAFMHVDAGPFEISFSLSGYAAATYLVAVDIGGKRWMRKLVKTG